MPFTFNALFSIFHPFVVVVGWDVFLDLVVGDFGIEEGEWLLRWLTAGTDLPVADSDYQRFIQALEFIGPDVLGLGEDSSSEDSFDPTSVEIVYLDDEDDEGGIGYGLPSDFLRILLPREQVNAKAVAAYARARPYGENGRRDDEGHGSSGGGL